MSADVPPSGRGRKVEVDLWYLDVWTTCIPIVVCGGVLTMN